MEARAFATDSLKKLTAARLREGEDVPGTALLL
jgi:hypothetical protein